MMTRRRMIKYLESISCVQQVWLPVYSYPAKAIMSFVDLQVVVSSVMAAKATRRLATIPMRHPHVGINGRVPSGTRNMASSSMTMKEEKDFATAFAKDPCCEPSS